MCTALTCPGHRCTQACSKATESAPPLNATASGKFGSNACNACGKESVMAKDGRTGERSDYLLALVSV
jgi:hypothetical protein